MAEMALSAYDDAEKIEQDTKERGFEDFTFFDNEGTQGFCCADDERTILSFRGTEVSQFQDLVSDLRFLKTEGPLGDVHRGFKLALDQVWPDVEEKVRALDGRRLFITGHSLGAALATLTTATLTALGLKVDAIYTFGQPKIGDETFAKEYDKRIGNAHYRFVNNNDVVTRVPNVGFDHVGKFVYINTKGTLTHDIGTLKLEMDRIAGRIEDLGKPGTDGAKDHSMEKYVDHLKNNISEIPFH